MRLLSLFLLLIISGCGGGGGGSGESGGGGSSIEAPAITIIPANLTAIKDREITPIIIINRGGAATFGISPELPAGITINTSTGTISGTPTITTAITTYQITASNISGIRTVTVLIGVNGAQTISMISGVVGLNGSRQYSDFEVFERNSRFYLEDKTRNIETKLFTANLANRLNPTIATHSAATIEGFDKDGVDAHGNTEIVYDYFKSVLGLNSFNNLGAKMTVRTNVDFPQVPQTFCGTLRPPGYYLNAYWHLGEVSFTSVPSRRSSRTSLATSLDVTAHEWGHAVSDSYSNLIYNRESGALNEAFSDWIAAAVEHSRGNTDWLIGDDVISGGFRSMSSPTSKIDPDTYKGKYWKATDTASCPTPILCENDFCGVHSNSGVANKMFQLLVDGGTHNGVTVVGIGMTTAIKIATDAIRNHWVSTTNFAAAKIGMATAAQPYGNNATTQVNRAWEAVGVQ